VLTAVGGVMTTKRRRNVAQYILLSGEPFAMGGKSFCEKCNHRFEAHKYFDWDESRDDLHCMICRVTCVLEGKAGFGSSSGIIL